MPFSNQFALSLELTRLLPQIGWAADKAISRIISHARELRQSGSDIVVEEELAHVFGRCKISDTLTSSFKTIVAKSNSNVPLLEAITLSGGPGPTVIRAFQETPYFAMVVQISLLVWTFDSRYLATALTEALRKRSEGAPSSSGLPSSPDRQGILGVLRACESQTSAFNWNMMLNAVSTTLGYEAEKAPIDIPHFVLQGLLDMFPMVQTLPSDRLIHIQVPLGEDKDSGTSTLVVWAHHVLGLTVLVRPRDNDGQLNRSFRFGTPGLEQVFIDEVAADNEAFITLLDAQREHLLTIRTEPDTEYGLIGSVRRIPARGWGNSLLVDNLANVTIFRAPSRAVIEDMQIVTTAFAFVVAKNLVKDDSHRNTADDKGKMRDPITYDVDEQRLLQASRFLFDNPHISRGSIDSFVKQCSFKALDERLPRPLAMEAAARALPFVKNHDHVVNDEWNIICGHARALGILLIALAHVVNLEDFEDLMFVGFAFSDMFQHTLAIQLEEWNGNDFLRIPDEAWLQALAVPLLSHQQNIWRLPWDKVCLISDKGWSCWISTFGGSDPAYIRAGSVSLGRGSPCRNGVWKTGIRDSPLGGYSFAGDPERAESCGQAASLRCAENVTLDTTYCGEGDDVFLVCARLRIQRAIPGQNPVQRVGYKELQRHLWWAPLSKRCSHGSQVHKNMRLGVGCATIAGFGNYLYKTEERVLVCLTAHSVGARWLAIATIPWLSIIGDDEVEDVGERQILLRGNDCCFQCAIDQAAAQAGKWCIIL